MRRSRFFCFYLFIGILVFNSCAKVDNNVRDFSFVFMTDLHLKPDSTISSAFDRVIDTVNSLGVDFVISGGDQVYDVMRGNVQRSDSLFQFFLEKKKRFNVPVYTTVGNHDLFGIYEESDVDSTHIDYKTGMYQRYLGEPYYSFDHKNWHFVVLNSLDVQDKKYIGKVDSDQMKWLKADLAEIPAETPVVVALHIPLVSAFKQVYPATGSDEAYHKPMVINRSEILELLQQYNVKLVLQGHLHWLEDLAIENHTHYITGGSVAGRPSWRGTRHGPQGFLHFHVSGDEVTWDYIDYGGGKSFRVN